MLFGSWLVHGDFGAFAPQKEGGLTLKREGCRVLGGLLPALASSDPPSTRLTEGNPQSLA